jgi:hypothetical protein
LSVWFGSVPFLAFGFWLRFLGVVGFGFGFGRSLSGVFAWGFASGLGFFFPWWWLVFPAWCFPVVAVVVVGSVLLPWFCRGFFVGCDRLGFQALPRLRAGRKEAPAAPHKILSPQSWRLVLGD